MSDVNNSEESRMSKEERLMQWLRDAHAMEMQAATMLEKQADRIEHYPALKGRIEQHLDETRQQAEMVEGCIKRRGGDTSTMKDTAGKAAAMVQTMGGLFAGDEIVKSAMAGYTFEHFEISAYRALSAAAEDVGDTETKRVCEQILEQEEDMASWLSDHLPDVAQTYLRREDAGMEAKV